MKRIQGFLRTHASGTVLALAIAAAPLLLPPSAAAEDRHVTLPGHVGAAMGKPGAPIVLVEFTDLECPNCKQFHRDVFERLRAEYIDTGKVLFIHRDLPLPQHPHAVVAAHGLRCAGDQGAFWPMRQMLLVNDTLNADIVELAARMQDIDLGEFRRCMRDGRFLSDIDRDLTDAHAAGLRVTPSFVLGRLVPDGIEGVAIEGTATFEELDARFKELLK